MAETGRRNLPGAAMFTLARRFNISSKYEIFYGRKDWRLCKKADPQIPAIAETTVD